MAYRDHWFRHFIACVNGEGWSNTLAKDFWDEDLWEPNRPVTWRWLKLVWVYSMSVITQITLPLLVAATVIHLYDPIPLRWWLIFVGGTSGAAIAFAILIATTAYIDQRRKSKHE